MSPTPVSGDPPAGPKISLLPREHGAYALVAFPQVSALMLGDGNLGAFLLAGAVACAFLLHEPVLVFLGRRGPRAERAVGVRARRRATALGVIGLGCGFSGILFSAAPVWSAIPAVVLGMLVGLLTFRGAEKSVGGEVLVALAFALALIPTAMAGGVPGNTAWLAAALWAAAFFLATLTVQAVIDRHKRRRRLPAAVLALVAAGVGTGVLVVALNRGAPGAEAALLPPVAVTLTVLLSGLTPRHLRRLGWSLVAANTMTLVVILVFLP